MKTTIATLVLLALASPSFAIESITSTGLSCQSIHSVVNQKRSVLLRYSGRSGMPIYNRVVANSVQCNGAGTSQRAYFPAADTKSCPVLVCVSVSDLRP